MLHSSDKIMQSKMSDAVDDTSISASHDSEFEAFKFTHTLYITPHNSTHKTVKIHDITGVSTAPYSSDRHNEETEEIGQARPDEAANWILDNHHHWRTATLHPGHAATKTTDTALASWTPSRWSQGKNEFDFPPGSPHSSHGLVMQRQGVLSYRVETFVKDSVQYLWRYDGYSRRKLTLWKVLGGGKTAVAKYKAPYRVATTGGTLVVDSGEVDLVVAVLTCLGMLRKIRQSD